MPFDHTIRSVSDVSPGDHVRLGELAPDTDPVGLECRHCGKRIQRRTRIIDLYDGEWKRYDVGCYYGELAGDGQGMGDGGRRGAGGDVPGDGVRR